MWLIVITFFILTQYLVLVSIFYVGWQRLPLYENKISIEKIESINISVIVACRDEENSIGRLIQALLVQTYTSFELIIVNDHSNDNTVEIISKSLDGFRNAKLIHAAEFGKKNAIKEGVLSAVGNFIVTTDADCVPGPEWLKTISDFQMDRSPDLIIGPVQLIENQTLFSKIQALEFLSLIVSGAGASGVGMPIMCNGANLAFRKEIWLDSQHFFKENEISGDDIFLLHSVKRKKGKILFLKSVNAIVKTDGAESLAAFFKQRRRWTSKAGSYDDWQTILVAIIIFILSLLQITTLILSFFDFKFFMVLLVLFVIKFVIDLILLHSVQTFFKIKNIFKNSFILSLFYPFYILYTTFSTFFLKSKSWK